MDVLTLIFTCRRCLQGEVVFPWAPSARQFSLESRCSACRAVHQLGVELVARDGVARHATSGAPSGTGQPGGGEEPRP